MTYPPGSGPYGYGPQHQPPGWGQPGYQPPQPGWDPNQGYPGGGYPPPPPPKSNTGLIIGIVVATIAVLVVGAGALVLIDRNKRGEDNRATGTTTPELVTATETATPRGTATAQPVATKFSYREQAKDWNFRLGDVALHADWVDGRDASNCGDIEVGGKLTALGCQYVAEMVYRSERGGLMLTQYVLGMADADKAAAAVGRYTDEDLQPRPGSYIEDFTIGKWKDDSEKQFLVIILVTTTAAVDEETASKYLRYLHQDMLGALAFR
ncbi:hypothetical protein NDR87_15135 [Nocardia sp. CDC159]|uniref:Uncharacterized protein n=1 Tax=Nocardia pulmonis TaxID=2951408 RepID=A0A9X2E9Y8_9NOCA|nr:MULTISPECIES: hypothetical protein [Nocardia]MCM6775575.1 hypothetical protein [Nocardia pulmonis]MCM6787691.1 hypothetical protein [Nocardia sp. CDC159]